MKPAPFDYRRCESRAEALEVLHEYGDEACVLAGGQSLVAMLNMRVLQPGVLADISRVSELHTLGRTGDGRLNIGAAVTQSQLLALPDIGKSVPLLALAMPNIGHVQTRNRGTVCGSLAHADPSAELPLVASVLNATIRLASHEGERAIAARDFFTGLLETARRPDELIVAVEFPIETKNDARFAFREVSMRHGDFAITSIAVRVTAQALTIGVGGGPSRPDVREWDNLEGSALDDALNQFAWEMDMQDDVHATAKYRRHLVREIGRQTINEARQCLS